MKEREERRVNEGNRKVGKQEKYKERKENKGENVRVCEYVCVYTCMTVTKRKRKRKRKEKKRKKKNRRNAWMCTRKTTKRYLLKLCFLLLTTYKSYT